ncbi:hypothetical protein PUT72_10505 [Vibrio alginolyticus]|uniref:hypothetical protein n=1 Tax=Vibrio alginolyticus TaxID=663 RepID=UPI0023678AF6|nr:hypothetical protein [Vibrio alginolyticus]EGR2606667.1 hypothetical protein [Vibrio alginolyticus]WDG12624.1 hypothetical protein PUT72_10505 [Vibrio alginolyticus]
MQISTHDAVKMGFVLDENHKKLDHTRYMNKSSFDLEFKTILTLNKSNNTILSSDRLENLKPQECAYLVSKQYLCIPKGYIAYVFLKNRMCQRGLLALNTGIVDQEYYGPLSTLVINLSKESASIPNEAYPDDLSFFRVVFHKVDENTDPDNFEKISSSLTYPQKFHEYEHYLGQCKVKLRDYPENFLNTADLETRLQEEIRKKAGDFSLKKITTHLAFLAAVFALLPFLRDYYFSEKFDLRKYSTQVELNQASTDNLGSQITDLKEEVALLKEQLARLRDKPDTGVKLTPQPMLTQNLNISASSPIDDEAIKQDLVDSVFSK